MLIIEHLQALNAGHPRWCAISAWRRRRPPKCAVARPGWAPPARRDRGDNPRKREPSQNCQPKAVYFSSAAKVNSSGKVTARFHHAAVVVASDVARGCRPIPGRVTVPAGVVESRFAYHFTRFHTSLDEPLAEPRLRGGRCVPQRCRQRTPAQAAGITNHRWAIIELLSYPLPMTMG